MCTAGEKWRTTSAMESLLVDQHYVYLYRDEGGKVRYVGYGRSSDRPSSHLSGGSHSPALNDFLAKQSIVLKSPAPLRAKVEPHVDC